MNQQRRREEGPATSRGEATRAIILKAARRIFERDGYFDARVADIASKAGVSHGTFYSYFDCKEAAFKAVVTKVVEDLMTRLAVADAPQLAEPIDTIRRANKRYMDAYRDSAIMIGLLEQQVLVQPDICELRLAAVRTFNTRIARGIAHMQAEGKADPDLDPVLAAEALGLMVDRTYYMWFVLDQKYDEEAMLDTLTTLWARAIGAVGRDLA